MIFALTLLLSAALVFLVQPLLAKQLLPALGGGAVVWTACMLFFQTMLLLGYSYAHLLGRFLAPLQQRMLHSSLVLVSVIWLVTVPEADLTLTVESHPQWQVWRYLLLSIGLPYLLLSATAPLVQHWFAGVYQGKSPYMLYALSNVGSVLGLLCYPFLLEPLLALDAQFIGWQAGFVLFALLLLVLLWRFAGKLPADYRAAAMQLKQRALWRWLALSACGVVLLLSVTQQLTQNIAPVPFLWVLPLLLYLLSYILAFAGKRWYQRQIWLYVFCINLVVALALFYVGRQFDVTSQLAFYLLILFSGCMLCHGELAHSAPERSGLTAFYFWLALGGALGSVLMNLLLPLLFVRQFEFLLVLVLICALVLTPLMRQQRRWQLLGGAIVLLFGTTVWLAEQYMVSKPLFSGRNFYGSVQVTEQQVAGQLQRVLIDGTTSHGSQFLSPPLSNQAQSYYRQGSGAALALQHFIPSSPRRTAAQLRYRNIGLVGLGSGALAVYGQPGDSMTFFEINPLVVTAASNYFSYLSDSAAEVTIATGDGRQLLAQRANSDAAPFDILVLDAFSSDSIPQHLLTAEAMQLYWQQLAEDGILAIHVSNNYLDLTALLRNHAQNLAKQSYFFALPETPGQTATEWVLITNNRRFSEQAVIQQARRPWPTPENANIMWRDNYSNLLQLLK